MSRRLLGLPALATLVLATAAGALTAGGPAAARPSAAAATPAQLVAAARAAGDSARSVHVSATGSVRFDLYLVAGKGGRGRMSEGGFTFDLIRIGPKAWFRGGSAFWRHFAGSSAVKLFHGRWLQASATHGDLAALTPVTNIHTLLGKVLGTHGKLALAGRTTIGGVPAVAIRDTTQGGTLYVAARGKPYPLAISMKGKRGGTVRFEGWNAPVALTAPRNAIDISKLNK